ncbi:MAG: radical SAM protein [Rhodospirillales bacterium]|nr:radical SAM protein [Rhodospirillales bacterium]
MVNADGLGGQSKTTSDEIRHGGFEPAYVGLLKSGALAERVQLAERHLEDCDLCARYCHVNRRQSIRGAVCRTGERAVVYSYGPHHGEENCLRGWRGSGTIFFSWCNLRCVFCQNWEISWKGQGRVTTADELADMMIELQASGCHNINLVSPSHVVAQILAAVAIAAEKGLRLPLVYNTGGYDSLEALGLLDGVVDIYMPDMKYGSSAFAKRYSHVKDYVRFNRAAVREMHRQVGDLRIDAAGLARRGLLVRHLILPSGIAGTEQVLEFLAEEISPETYINLMDQYRPCYRAGDYPELDRPITVAEYQEVQELARRAGLARLDRRAKVRRFVPQL